MVKVSSSRSAFTFFVAGEESCNNIRRGGANAGTAEISSISMEVRIRIFDRTCFSMPFAIPENPQ